MVGEAVKVTEVPAQIVVADALMATAGVTEGFTVIVILFDVAVVGETQAALDVMIQLITSPFAGAAITYVLLFEPTLPPLRFHW